MNYPHEKGTQVDAHRSPLPPLRAALGGRRAVLLPAFTLLLAVLAFAATALATTFGTSGSEGGELSAPRGIAVDSSGDVFVADSGNQRIVEFSSTGAFIKTFGKEVNKTAVEESATRGSEENVCPAPGHPDDVCQAASAGTAAGEFGSEQPQGVAIDPSGDVYATDVINHRVLEFDSAGNFVRGFGHRVGGAGVDVCTSICAAGGNSTSDGSFGWGSGVSGSFIAVDSSGNVWVGDKNRLEEFEPNGTYVNKIELPGAGEPIALAADGAGNLYEKSASIAGVRKFEASSGTEVGASPYPLDSAGAPVSLATNSADDLFVGDTSGDDHILGYGPAGGQLSSFGRGELTGELLGIAAYHSAAGDLYASEATSDRIALLSLPAPGPLVESQSATEVGPVSATLNAALNPEGGETTYSFEYGTTPAYGESTPVSSPIGEDFATHQASAEVEGLQAETTYHYRVLAHNPAGTVHGPDATFTTQPPVFIDAGYTTNLNASSVDLNAEINPNGADTTYHFEWGTSTSYGNTVPVPDEHIGSGSNDILVSQRVNGLGANTTYHWRVVATNPNGTSNGPDHTFIYQPESTPSATGCPNAQLRTNYSSALPDCRAYEQVSPVDKNDGDVATAFEGVTNQQASVEGERVFYESHGAFPGVPAEATNIQYLASRGASGWSTRPAGHSVTTRNLPSSGGTDYILPLSPDLSAGVLKSELALVPGAPGPEIWNLYVGDPLTDSSELVTDVNPPNRTGNRFEAFYQGSSADFSHVFFSANDALTPEAPVIPIPEGELGQGKSVLYEWVEGRLLLVGLIPTSGTSCTRTECTPTEGADFAGGGYPWRTHAISTDGSRAFFTDATTGRLYMRENGERTLEVPDPGRCLESLPPTQRVCFITASDDGTEVLLSDGRIYDRSESSGSFEPLADLSQGHGGFKGILAASEALSSVYFVAEAVLAPNSNSRGAAAVAGQPNLYLWSGGQTTFIATLDPGDALDWGQPEAQPIRVLPDGAQLVFDSKASLTGYDNTDVNTGEPDTEVYLYDATANRLICASCNPSGARPIGSSDLNSSGSPLYRPRNLSADGSRLFFTSRDALLPGDTNGLYDVYEWEAEGSGNCRSSADNGGCLYLISNGSAASDSYFADASTSGNDVFFATGDRLVGQDQDDYRDLYDARVDGGFPESPPPAPCEGESCRGEDSHAPAPSGAGTAAFQGPGNPTPKHCKHAFALRHGKCTKKKHRKKHHRKHHDNFRSASDHRRAGR